MIDEQECDCGSGKSFTECCGPILAGKKVAESAEALMRSRYCAFKRKNESYLLASWANETRPESIEFTPDLEWVKLQINGRKMGRKKDSEGWVTFVAHYRMGQSGLTGYLHEKSYFRKEADGLWRYVDGEVKSS
ncbi:YchJ family metal-binding protein [Thiomicrorhabdus sp.]|uniref:YchJ family protein n=1 Tax=Thiomicrorhabdus sp. TaxID=2039724 RepID=UPI0029C7BCEC|nr:YchJ family metal-binding protein [Thiomicrorhabdus sp.]